MILQFRSIMFPPQMSQTKRKRLAPITFTHIT